MSNSQDRFSFVRLLTCGGIAFLLLGLFLTSSAQADLIYAARVNVLNGATKNSYYSNANFSIGNSTSQWCSQTKTEGVPYVFQDGTHDYSPVLLCDLGALHTISSIDFSPYGNANTVKALKVEFYDTPALSGTPAFTQEFTNISASETTILNLSSAVQARYAKFTLTANYGGDRVGVGDVMFNVENYLKTPTSSSSNESEVPTLSGYSVSHLYLMDASKTWCSNAKDDQKGYFNGTNKNPVFTFNYDTPVTLSNVFIQTYPANGNSLKNFTLEITDSAGNTSTHDYVMTDCNYGVQNVFSFPEVENVTSVKMTVSSNFRGIAPGGGDRIGVGGVYFSNLELDLPTTPVKNDAPLHDDNIIVRPTGAAYATEGSATTSGVSLSVLYDGSGTGCGINAWYTNQVGSENDFLNKGLSPVIDLTLPKGTYDSFSVWGYGSPGNQMTEFILELLNNGEVVFADEYHMDRRTAGQYSTYSLDGNYLFDTARITILDSGFARFENSGGDRVGFAEIAFYQEPYYFANSPDASDETWTIDGTTKKGVRFIENGDNTTTFTNSVTLSADGLFDIGEGKQLTINNAISGNNGLEKIGAGTLTLSGSNTYTGETTVTEGTLQLTGDGVHNSGPITVDTNGTLEYNIPSGQTEKATITDDNAIVSAGKVIKTGEGTLKIDAAEGAVDAHSFVVSSGRLDMKTYFKGSLIIGEELEEDEYTTATFSPGNSIDTLTIDGDFELNPGSTLLMEIGGQSADENDKLIVTGDFTIADDAIIYLALAEVNDFTSGDAFEALIQAGSADDDFTDAISSAIVPGWPFYDWSVNKSGNVYSIRGFYDPNAVPEPSTWALMALGVVVLFLRKRVRN